MHRADGQLATGAGPVIEPDIAADGIDEWLTFVTVPDPGREDTRLAGLRPGQSLHVHAGDVPSGQGEWLISHGPAASRCAGSTPRATPRCAARRPACCWC